MQASTRSSRGSILALGVLFLLTAAIASPSMLSSWSYHGRTASGAAATWIHVARIVLAVCGIGLLGGRNSRVVQAIGALLARGGAFVRFLIGVAFVAVLVEALSFALFHWVLPTEMRSAAYFVAGADVDLAEREPFYEPDRWLGYAPNPACAQNNEHGWRYGGGPKRAAKRILCLGGSTTWNNVDQPSETYPAQLETRLRELGHDVDVVNGGVSYYTSAEVLAMLAYRGVHLRPDVVVFHTGGNDIEPFLSPGDYKPDYTHWRSHLHARPPGRIALFRASWRIPSWTVRLGAFLVLRPPLDQAHSASIALHGLTDSLYADEPIDRSRTALAHNLRSAISIAKGIGAKPVVVLFKVKLDKLDVWLKRIPGFEPALAEKAKERLWQALLFHNELMAGVARDAGVPVLRFDEFEPSSQAMWVDHCHLDATGCREKAKHFADFLIEKGVLE